jgi:hypothetical protein
VRPAIARNASANAIQTARERFGSLEYHPTEELDKESRVPEAITRVKDRMTVKFQAQRDTTAGELLEVRTLR